MITVLLLTGVNYVVDPFYFFRWNEGISQDPGNPTSANRRARTACLLKNSPSDTYQGIIVGGSKSWPISEELMRTYTGQNWLSCSVASGNFNDYENIIRYALQHQDLNEVVLHLSGYEVKGSEASAEWYRMPEFVTTDNELNDILYYLFTGFEESVNHLAEGTAPNLTERFTVEEPDPLQYSPLNEDNYWIADGMGMHEIADMNEESMDAATVRIQTAVFSRLHYYYGSTVVWGEQDEYVKNQVLSYYGTSLNDRLDRIFNVTKNLAEKRECLRHLQNIIDLCEEYDVNLTVIVGAAFLGERAHYEGPEYWDYLYEVAQMTDFYDFSYFCDINMNPYNFYDYGHYLDFVAYVIIDNVFGDAVIPFGHTVTAENVEDCISERQAYFYMLEREYQETGTVQLEERGSESDLSSISGEFWLEMLSRARENAA